MSKLRFCPLIRVSTESQEKKGESLATQKSQIISYVKTLDGEIPADCWEYVGQESATPEKERQLFKKLMQDSEKGKFDAVIVTSIDRFSRANKDAEASIEIWKNAEIRFFVGTMEMHLFNELHKLNLTMGVAIGEFQAMQQARKSLEARIHKAERNCPTSGSLPYGRIWDKKTEVWSTDPDKKQLIQRCAERYLSGEPLYQIADSVGMNRQTVREILILTSGSTWEVRFRSPRLKIDKTVIINHGQPLLDPDTIQAVKDCCEANKTYMHGEIKYRYLLSRMIFCKRCGYAMYGYTSITGKHRRYYRHYTGYTKNPCKLGKLVPADQLGNSVLIHLVQTFGDVERIKQAVSRATPNYERVEQLRQEVDQYTLELDKVIKKKEHVVDQVADGLLTKQEIEVKMTKLRNQESAIKTSIEQNQSELANLPDPVKVKRYADLSWKMVHSMSKNHPEHILTQPYENKRVLVQHAFGGKDSKGHRLGVYVDYTGDKNQPWQVEIRGKLGSSLLGLPLTDQYLEDAFKLDSDYQDVAKELQKIRDSVSKPAQSMPGLPHENSYHTLYC